MMAGTQDNLNDPTLNPTPKEPGDTGPPQVEGFELIRGIGSGGMGDVFLARQLDPDCQVALKLVSLDHMGPDFESRFRAEYQALARMDHPHIARFLTKGYAEDGAPYFSMEFIDGVPITEFCTRWQLPLEERLALFQQLCEGVQHAHQKALVHRDLKPGNVLVTLVADKPVVKIIDFGIAALVSEQPKTEVHPTGTPAYMSPEQLAGEPPDVRTDLFALGTILFEMLGGGHPIDRERLDGLERPAAFEVLRTAQRPRLSTRLAAPAADSRARAYHKRALPLMRLDLDWIAAKALALDADERYASVSELQRDLADFLADRPISAREGEWYYSLQKSLRRNHYKVMAAGALLIFLTLGLLQFLAVERANRNVDQILSILSQIMAAASSSEAGPELKLIDLLKSLDPDFDQSLTPQNRIMIRQVLGETYFSLAEYRVARQTFEIVLTEPGHHPREQQRAHLFLARVKRRTQNYEEALHHLDLMNPDQDLEPAMLIEERLERADIHREQGKLIQAESVLDSIPMVQVNAGQRARVLVVRGNVATERGNWPKAYKFLQAAYDLQKHSPELPATMATRNNLANALLELKKYSQAHELFEINVNSRVKRLGENHHLTIKSIYGLAKAKHRLKAYTDAQKRFEHVVAYREANDLENLIGVREYMARNLEKLKQLDQAIDILSELNLECGTECSGVCIRIRNNLGDYLNKQTHHQEARDVLSAEFPDCDLDQNSIYATLAETNLALCEPESALAAIEKADPRGDFQEALAELKKQALEMMAELAQDEHPKKK